MYRQLCYLFSLKIVTNSVFPAQPQLSMFVYNKCTTYTLAILLHVHWSIKETSACKNITHKKKALKSIALTKKTLRKITWRKSTLGIGETSTWGNATETTFTCRITWENSEWITQFPCLFYYKLSLPVYNRKWFTGCELQGINKPEDKLQMVHV